MNKDSAIDYINSHNITEIKAGNQRTTSLKSGW
ncbi:hypothetical protein QF044_001529 [Chryseobacterium sp. W4I1]|nr:hypothetical protein [Chryseobacterium sp. W4I1]